MRKLISSMGRQRSLVLSGVALLALVFVLGGAALASNMGFKLNFGILNAINRLFCPSGYNQQGEWTGKGSGISFSVSVPEEGANGLSLDLTTPAGTFSVPYAYEEKRPRGPGRMRPQGVVTPNAGMKYSGTNLTYNPIEPLMFTSADGVAQVTIESSVTWNPMVRYTGTGLCVGSGAKQAYIHVTPETITLELGEGVGIQTETWTLEAGGWTRQR